MTDLYDARGVYQVLQCNIVHIRIALYVPSTTQFFFKNACYKSMARYDR